ncbi:DUF3017 domain-containing protein [Gordonia sp. (in: high G+C Gram-positive bacteria)]|uniref:DUF3017 domain-containing protein n=1 Tax=unclassified Gordonia (in: high G+C Gram-positive bacteria) TaxID=2657482 RepID=UPI002624426E|nr:DUF3017 domain-containing protein [Gordonia sp. (in: high G+C Gram-positive bacteria)]
MTTIEARRQRRTRRRQRIVRQIPFFAVLAVVAVAAILVLFDRWRRGSVAFGAALLLGAALRAALPSERAGLLQVRSRAFDIGAMAAAGVLVIWLATSIDSLGTGDTL